MRAKKALILYGSLTGNTAQVGAAFADVCKRYGFETETVQITPSRDWDKEPVIIEDYDLVALGSPVIAGLPYKEVSMVLGLQGNKCLAGGAHQKEKLAQREFEDPNTQFMDMSTGIPGVVAPACGGGVPGTKGEFKKTVYGVVFATYGGNGGGPTECRATLEAESEYLRVNGVRTVGMFACPGKERHHTSVDTLRQKFGINIDDIQALIQDYKDNPNSERVKSLPTKLQEALKTHAEKKDDVSYGDGVRMMADNDPLGCGLPGYRMWHYNCMNRPSERDITKAQIFLSEVIEDHFLTFTGDPRPPYSMYTCLA